MDSTNIVNFKDLCVGDNVTIHFYPYSQRYLDELTSKEGEITNIGPNIFDYKIKTNAVSPGYIEYLFHDGVSYYGDSLGYDYTIYRK